MNNLDTKIDPNHAENTATVSQIFNFTNKVLKTQERKRYMTKKRGKLTKIKFACCVGELWIKVQYLFNPWNTVVDMLILSKITNLLKNIS